VPQSQAEPVLPSGEASEQRAAPRLALVLRVGKLCLPQGDFLCVLRDVSATGVKVRLFHDLPEHGACTLELGSGDRHQLTTVWQADGHAGYRFANGQVDIPGLIDETTPFPRRQLRLRVDCPVALASSAGTCRARLRDISQHGVLLDCDEMLAVGLAVEVEGAGLPALSGRIRWRSRRAHGLVLQRSFRLDELALLVATLHRRSSD
jgi:PilZ domain